MSNNNKLLLLAALLPILLVASPLVFAQTSSDFSTAYKDGQAQAQADGNNGFHLGSICSNNSNQYCEGYISGYLDQWFSHLPTSTHTTTIIRESHRGGGCHDGNCTKGPTPIPKPTPPPTPPPCKKINGTCA